MAYIKVPLNNIISIEKIVSVFSMRLAPDFRFLGESHDFWELIYVDDGEISIRYGEERCRLERGEVFFHKPNEFHDVECDGRHAAKIFITSFECHSAAMDFFVEKAVRLGDGMCELIRDILDEAELCFSNRAPLTYNPDAPVGSQQMLRCYLEMLLIRIMRQAEGEASRERIFFTSREKMLDRMAHDVAEYLEKRACEVLTLDEICEHFHFSKSHLCHIFKAQMGCGIKQYLIRLRIDRAKELLCESDMTVGEIAGRLAFESPQHFARIFKRAEGVTPSEYRRGRQ